MAKGKTLNENISANDESKAVKANKAKNKDKVKTQKKSKPTEKVKRSRTKETISELKKVSWPSFAKTMKQTGMVISVVVIFMLLIIGIDQLLIWLLSLAS